jgi:hypothetical protein
MVVNMLLFGNYIWKTFKIKMSHQVALPTSTNASTSKINPKSTTTWSVMDNKGKQSQILTSRKKMLKMDKTHKFRITLQNLMMILKPVELNVIIVKKLCMLYYS